MKKKIIIGGIILVIITGIVLGFNQAIKKEDRT
jgi:uncharacterized protein YpmB